MKLAGKIGFIWFAIIFAGVFLLFYPLFLLFLSHPSMYPAANFLRKVWAWLTILLCFSWPKWTREEKDFPSPCVFVSNHTSYLDIVAFGLLTPMKIAFMGKVELARIPLFGIFFRTVDIGVNRSSLRDAHKAYVTAREKINDGYSIVIFPEGTIWEKTPLLKPFKNGAFKLAIDNKIPVVPITFYNNYKILPDEKFEYYPGTIKYKIHRAIETSHLNDEDKDSLRDEIYTVIETELKNQKIIV